MLLYYIIILLASIFFFIYDTIQIYKLIFVSKAREDGMYLFVFSINLFLIIVGHTISTIILPFFYKLSSIKDLQTMTMTINIIYLFIFLFLFSYNLKNTISSPSVFNILITALWLLCFILQTLDIFIPYYATKI